MHSLGGRRDLTCSSLSLACDPLHYVQIQYVLERPTSLMWLSVRQTWQRVGSSFMLSDDHGVRSRRDQTCMPSIGEDSGFINPQKRLPGCGICSDVCLSIGPASNMAIIRQVWFGVSTQRSKLSSCSSSLRGRVRHLCISCIVVLLFTVSSLWACIRVIFPERLLCQLCACLMA